MDPFWLQYGTSFRLWFKSLPYNGQFLIVTNAIPDLPTKSSLFPSTPASLLLPEFTLEYLLSDGGNGLLSFLYPRMMHKKDDVLYKDILYLKTLHAKGNMPLFSQNQFTNYHMAYIELLDTEHYIHLVQKGNTSDVIKTLEKRLLCNEIMEADVWLTLQMRTSAIDAFLQALREAFEKVMTLKIPLKVTVGCRVCGKADLCILCRCGVVQYCSQEHMDSDNHQQVCTSDIVL